VVLFGQRAKLYIKAKRVKQENLFEVVFVFNGPGQSFLKDVVAAVTEIRELGEDVLLADRAALASEDPAVVRVVQAKRRVVEIAVKYAGRLQIPARDGLELAEKWFQPQEAAVEGLSEEELRIIRVRFYLEKM
jgi:hypothetical protein